ncbi:UDP-2-acetamido-2,6-beta-L-arabino-hexul-4-ose reductase [Anaerotaenia torta]|uniref:polysaccharide biosynthesis C-terminal domain-containing protein n=1 Tax=Anaerotaenia torta TaxID=433293 RepID=UPI003D2477E2
MKILVTGAGGFLGKNLIAGLKAQYGEEHTIDTFDRSNTLEDLKKYTRDCDFIYHFAAVHRPVEDTSFMEVNYQLFRTMLEFLRENGNRCPVLYTSTVQAVQDTPYATSKRMAEEALREHEGLNNSKGIIYCLTNTFGKWAKPFAYSVVATFCHNISRNREIVIHNPDTVMKLYYIDDVTEAFLRHLKEEVPPGEDGYYRLKEEYCYQVTLQELADTIRGFQKAREELYIPDIKNSFAKKLYSTYVSYLPLEELKTAVTSHRDARGSFTEVFRTKGLGQFSLNVTKPGIKKGEHYHNSKCERFFVISGSAMIQLRRIGTDEIREYLLSADNPQIIEIPPGYAHNLINIGDTDLYTLIWANEVFDKLHGDTYPCTVLLK